VLSQFVRCKHVFRTPVREKLQPAYCSVQFSSREQTLIYRRHDIQLLMGLLPSGALSQTLDFFHHGISIVGTCSQLSSAKVDAQCDKPAIVIGQVDNTCDAQR